MRLALLATLALTGCAFGPAATPTPVSGPAITGIVHGGQQPITSAHVYLFAANTTGYGGSGIPASTANASISLLTTGDGSDATGTYVLTNSTGNFNINATQYTCTPGQQVYLYSLGGNPGAGANTSASLIAILGTCPAAQNFVAATPFVTMNEVTTIAAAYAFAGFASDATHVSNSGTPLAQTGITNAFANAANLANLAYGTALATTPAGNGTVPQTTINTLANILAACINSNGSTTIISSGTTSTASAAPCGTLFTNATLDGTSTGTQPAETASAALNIAHFPGTNITNLYNLQSAAASPFPTSLSAQPNDFTLSVYFSGGGMFSVTQIAIDAAGAVWTENGNSLSKLSSSGVPISSSAGYTGGGLSGSHWFAIDNAGSVWATSASGFSGIVAKFDNNGNPLSPSTGFTGGGMQASYAESAGIAIDSSGNAWIANQNSVTELSSTGTAISPTAGFPAVDLVGGPQGLAIDVRGNIWRTAHYSLTVLTPNGTDNPLSINYSSGVFSPIDLAFDGTGNAWVADGKYYVDELSDSGVPISPSTGYQGGGVKGPQVLAIDGAGNVWTPGSDQAIAEFSNTGIALSPSTGFKAKDEDDNAIAVDGSGNVWASTGLSTIIEFVGIGTPVVTPIAAGVANNTLGTRP